MIKIKKRKPELLIPVGTLSDLKGAIDCGADSIYLGGTNFSLRNKIKNFTLRDMEYGLEYAHDKGARVYITVNSAARNRDFDTLKTYIRNLQRIGVDALILWDPGLIHFTRKLAPELKIHLSTQANTVNSHSVKFWEEFNINRICLSRELSIKEIIEIRQSTKIELEIFIHGAMCISYSGRCLLSNYLDYKDAHNGLCTTPCRRKYYLASKNKPNEYMPIIEDDHGSYVLNSKDLCMIEHLPELINSGVDSFKIEGRQHGYNYITSITNIYKDALETYYKNPKDYKAKKRWIKGIKGLNTRGYTTGFYFNPPSAIDHNYEIK